MLTAPARFDAAVHDTRAFDCGRAVLNDWLRTNAARSEGSIARIYVVCDGAEVVGYSCMSVGSIERQAIPSKLKRAQGLLHQIPVGIIGRLARDVRYAGTGLGGDLLADAVQRLCAVSEIVGMRAVLVHALDADSLPFYESHGFLPSPLGERTLFLPMETIVSAL